VEWGGTIAKRGGGERRHHHLEVKRRGGGDTEPGNLSMVRIRKTWKRLIGDVEKREKGGRRGGERGGGWEGKWKKKAGAFNTIRRIQRGRGASEKT